MPEPSVALVDYLATALSITKGVDIFHAPEVPPRTQIEESAIFVIEVGGVPPSDDMSNGSLMYPQCQVMTRDKDYQTGRARARSALSNSHLATVSGFHDLRVQSSEPLYLGKDDKDLHRWSFTVEMHYYES